MKQQHFPRCIFATFTLAVIVAISLSAQAQTATINVTANQQTIDGFGFSTAWTPAMTAALPLHRRRFLQAAGAAGLGLLAEPFARPTRILALARAH